MTRHSKRDDGSDEATLRGRAIKSSDLLALCAHGQEADGGDGEVGDGEVGPGKIRDGEIGDCSAVGTDCAQPQLLNPGLVWGESNATTARVFACSRTQGSAAHEHRAYMLFSRNP